MTEVKRNTLVIDSVAAALGQPRGNDEEEH